MGSRSCRRGARPVVALVAAVLALTLTAAPATATTSTVPPPSEPATTEPNVFLPDDTSTNITDCISALPRPECGSRERGGWRQGLVLAAVVAGLVAIGVRVVVGVRRRDRQTAMPSPDHTAGDDA